MIFAWIINFYYADVHCEFFPIFINWCSIKKKVFLTPFVYLYNYISISSWTSFHSVDYILCEHRNAPLKSPVTEMYSVDVGISTTTHINSNLQLLHVQIHCHVEIKATLSQGSFWSVPEYGTGTIVWPFMSSVVV